MRLHRWCVGGLAAIIVMVDAGASSDAEPVRVVVTESTLDVLGRTAPVFRASTDTGERVLRGRRGERFQVELVNRTSRPITMHPHGLILPNTQDGVPYITQLPVPPEGTFTYDFVPVQAGTYFMHSHFGWQLQDQLVMPLILDEGDASDGAIEVVMMLTDFTFESPPEIFARLRSVSKHGADGMPGMNGMGGRNRSGAMPGEKAAPTPDLVDVDYDAVLANGRPIDQAEVIRVSPGSRVRLRLINGSSASNFEIDLGGLRGTARFVDGEPIHPVERSKVELGIAQRLDLLIDLPTDFSVAPLVAQAEGTKLIAAVVLAAPGATVPALAREAAAVLGAIGTGYRQERSFRAQKPLSRRAVNRSIPVVLGGKMTGYDWDLNGASWPDAAPMTVVKGDRVELVFRNDTMMSHPMHLHGHRFQVTEIDGERLDGAYRDTVLVMPKSTVKVEFDADNPGLWMMHCHILWHEAAGMMGVVEYEGVAKPPWYMEKDTFDLPSALPRESNRASKSPATP